MLTFYARILQNYLNIDFMPVYSTDNHMNILTCILDYPSVFVILKKMLIYDIIGIYEALTHDTTLPCH
jgi:hypothetical protein